MKKGGSRRTEQALWDSSDLPESEIRGEQGESGAEGEPYERFCVEFGIATREEMERAVDRFRNVNEILRRWESNAIEPSMN